MATMIGSDSHWIQSYYFTYETSETPQIHELYEKQHLRVPPHYYTSNLGSQSRILSRNLTHVSINHSNGI
jgi:hypothetical protein